MQMFDDLKQMENLKIDLYQLATKKDILDEMAYGFRRDLITFKPHWKTVHELASMRMQGVPGT